VASGVGDWECGGDAVGAVLAGGVVDEGVAFVGEVPGDARADALGRPGDDRDLAREFARQCWLP